jgi:hypothetical protein
VKREFTNVGRFVVLEIDRFESEGGNVLEDKSQVKIALNDFVVGKFGEKKYKFELQCVILHAGRKFRQGHFTSIMNLMDAGGSLLINDEYMKIEDKLLSSYKNDFVRREDIVGVVFERKEIILDDGPISENEDEAKNTFHVKCSNCRVWRLVSEAEHNIALLEEKWICSDWSGGIALGCNTPMQKNDYPPSPGKGIDDSEKQAAKKQKLAEGKGKEGSGKEMRGRPRRGEREPCTPDCACVRGGSSCGCRDTMHGCSAACQCGELCRRKEKVGV